MGTIDGRMVALDAKSGREIWNVAVEGARTEAGYNFTVAPLVVKNTIIVGSAGGEFGIRGFIAGFDPATGKEKWRFYTIPGKGEPGNNTWAKDSWMRGGAAVWVTGSYDPELNLTYWGTGNPGPDWNGDDRAGDNLYSDSVVALDPDTGKIKWHFQFTPHDEFDYDSTQVPVLADIDWQGRPRKVMLWANRNGVAYVLDRTTGEVLHAKPYVKVTWMNGFDKSWRPMRVPGQVPSEAGTVMYPTVLGATNWQPPSFSPRTGLFYVSAWENTSTVAVEGSTPRGIGANPLGQAHLERNTRTEQEVFGVVRALDPRTLDPKWEFKMSDTTWGGVLTTASDLVFGGGRGGYFFAVGARDGKLLW